MWASVAPRDQKRQSSGLTPIEYLVQIPLNCDEREDR
jgi:hypothetical protein